MKRFSLLIAGCLLVSSSTVVAKDVSQKMFPLGPVHSTNGLVIPKNTLITNLKTVFVEKDQAYDGSDKIFDPMKRDISAQRYNAIFRYGLGSRFDIRVIVPFINKEMDMFNPQEKVDGGFSNNGVGDTRVFLRYQISSQKQGDSFFSAIDLGVELPTGSDDEDFFLKNRKKLPPHKTYGVQLGDGSIDPILGVSATKLMKKHRLDASVMYFFNQEGEHDIKKGDQFDYNLGYSYLLHPKFMPLLEINGKNFEKNEFKGKDIDRTGGNEIFLTPGFSSYITKKFRFLIGYSFPIYRDMEKGAMGTKSMITAKFAYKW